MISVVILKPTADIVCLATVVGAVSTRLGWVGMDIATLRGFTSSFRLPDLLAQN